MELKDIYQLADEKMTKSVSALSHEFITLRAGRANPGVLDKITVDYYGVASPLSQVAALSVPDARTLMVQPWDKSLLKEIERAILTSDIGIPPQNDGSGIRLNFPPLTEERRKELVKQVHKHAEDFKVIIRNIRRDLMAKLKDMKKENDLTEDDVKDGEKQLQTTTDKFCKEIDDLTAKKEKEIMEI